MNPTQSHEHPSAERLEAFVDGALPAKAARSVEGHVASCVRCAAEVEGLQRLFAELEALPRLVPLEGFAGRVLQSVSPAGSLSLGDRLAARADTVLAGVKHPSSMRIQDFVEGLLPGGASGRVSMHLEGCTACRANADVWRAFLRQLDGLGHVAVPEGFTEAVLTRRALEAQLDALAHLEPSAGFADRVMAAVHVPPLSAAAPAAAPERSWGRLLSAARRRVPTGRQAWAALSGVAVTPVVTAGLVIWAVFSHPTLTPGALLSFTGWKIADAFTFGAGVASTALMESAGAFRLFTAVQSAAGSPTLVAVAFLAFSVGTIAALWVLYTNLVTTHPVDGRYAHASL